MLTHNLQLGLESDGGTYKERQQICLNAVATGDMQTAYKLMGVVMQKFISKSSHLFDANDRLADVQVAAAALVVDSLCDEIRYNQLHEAVAFLQNSMAEFLEAAAVLLQAVEGLLNDVTGFKEVETVFLEAVAFLLEAVAGFQADVVESDFLAMQPPLLEADKFDLILLNPPFSNHQDAAHAAHACRFVKSTGRVAAITSTAWAQQENNRKANEFRTFVAQVDGFIQQVPAGTFKASGTMVPTQILVIEGANLPWYQAARQLEDDTDSTEGEKELAMTDSPSA